MLIKKFINTKKICIEIISYLRCKYFSNTKSMLYISAFSEQHNHKQKLVLFKITKP